MGIADPEAALEKLREFRDLQDQADRHGWSDVPRNLEAAINHLMPVVKEIARALDKEEVDALSSEPFLAVDATIRLIGRLERQEDFRQIFGPIGPTLAARQLHPWVWDAVASLWDDGHYEPAVHEAAKAVELRTQLKIDRRDLDGKDLYSRAFSPDDPQPGAPRLRFPDIDKAAQPRRWTSAHEGAMFLGMGCAQGIRNPQAHPSPDIPEEEALEQLAALSVLARWVNECKPVGGGRCRGSGVASSCQTAKPHHVSPGRVRWR